MRVVVLANMQQRLADQVHFCEYLKSARDDYQFLFIVYDKSWLKAIGSCPFPTHSYDSPSAQFSAISRCLGLLIAALNRLSPSLAQMVLAVQTLKRLRDDYQWLTPILDEYQPDLAITNGDRHLNLEPAFLKQCRHRRTRVVVPYMVYSSHSGPLDAIRGHQLLEINEDSPMLAKWVAAKFPDSVLSESEKQYLFFLPGTQIALHLFRTLSRNPWYVGNGLSEVVCVDSQATQDRYAEHVDLAKLHIVGDIAYDILFNRFKARDAIKKRLVDKYFKQASPKKLVIVAVPQYGEHQLLDWPQHWDEIRFLFEAIKQSDCHILVSLHPKMDLENYRFLETDYGCRILSERLFESLPAADCFVASFSSTVIWAVLCGINTVVTHFFGYDNIFEFLTSVQVVSDRDQLAKKISEALDHQQDFSSDWAQLSRDLVFDGQTISRYVKLLDEVAS